MNKYLPYILTIALLCIHALAASPDYENTIPVNGILDADVWTIEFNLRIDFDPSVQPASYKRQAQIMKIDFCRPSFSDDGISLVLFTKGGEKGAKQVFWSMETHLEGRRLKLLNVSLPNVRQGGWLHLALSYSGGMLYASVNGAKGGSVMTGALEQGAGAVLRLGGGQCAIDDLKISSVIRTGEILEKGKEATELDAATTFLTGFEADLKKPGFFKIDYRAVAEIPDSIRSGSSSRLEPGLTGKALVLYQDNSKRKSDEYKGD